MLDIPPNVHGLSTSEARLRLEQYGYNEVKTKTEAGIFWQFVKLFLAPISLILLVSSAFSALLGDYRDAIIILLMVLLSSSLDFYQEYKSSKAVEQLAAKLARKSSLVRDNKIQEILITEIVPGDLLFASTGDIVAADSKVVHSDSLLTNESVLTGESYPLEKNLGDGVYAGTNIISGSAYLQVEKTGKATKFGKIAENLQSKDDENAFEKGTKQFSNLIFQATVVIVSLVLLINLVKNWWLHSLNSASIFEAILFSVSIAVGLTPELLPLILSINNIFSEMSYVKNC